MAQRVFFLIKVYLKWYKYIQFFDENREKIRAFRGKLYKKIPRTI